MKNLIFLAVIIILGLLQLTFLDAFMIFNIKPDLLLISALIASLFLEKKPALALSLFAGIFKDAFGSSVFGLNCLLFCLWSFVIIRISKVISIEDNFLRMALVFMVVLLHNIVYGAILIYLGNNIPLGIILRIIFVGSIYTALVFPLVFKIIKSSLKAAKINLIR
jgi:rod shape-determining protein MreD